MKCITLCKVLVVLAASGNVRGGEAQALPDMAEYMNMPANPVDSSEFGGQPGLFDTTCPCGTVNKQMSRIVSGVQTKPNEYPFTAYLNYNGPKPHTCGGTIITRRHILTAAHCAEDKDPKQHQVTLGEHDTNIGNSPQRKVFNVREVILHEKYIPVNQYDIALLVLEETIVFDRYMLPACFPSKPLNLGGQYYKIVGWGKIGWGPNDPGSPYLKKVWVKDVPLNVCGSMVRDVNVTDPHQICSFGPKRGMGIGDSGGPVIWLDPDTNRYTIVAIPSLVVEAPVGKLEPDVHANVSSFLPWILDNIKRTDSSSVLCTSKKPI